MSYCYSSAILKLTRNTLAFSQKKIYSFVIRGYELNEAANKIKKILGHGMWRLTCMHNFSRVLSASYTMFPNFDLKETLSHEITP